MHIWFDKEKPAAYVSARYRDEHYGSVYKTLDFENALRDIGAIDDYKHGRFVFPAGMLKKVRELAREIIEEDVIPNTEGMTVEFEGQQYTLAEDIHCEGALGQYHAEAYDPTGPDWPTTIYWDAWMGAGRDELTPDHPIAGVIVCDE